MSDSKVSGGESEGELHNNSWSDVSLQQSLTAQVNSPHHRDVSFMSYCREHPSIVIVGSVSSLISSIAASQHLKLMFVSDTMTCNYLRAAFTSCYYEIYSTWRELKKPSALNLCSIFLRRSQTPFYSSFRDPTRQYAQLGLQLDHNKRTKTTTRQDLQLQRNLKTA